MDPRKTTPPSWAGLFGDQHANLDQFGDLGPSQHPDDRSSAARHAAKRRAGDAAAQQARDVAIVAEAAAVEAGELALAQATKLIRDGQEVPRDLARRAARAAKAKGIGSRSSAQELAYRYRTRTR